MKKNHLYLLIIVALVGLLGYQIWNISTEEMASSASVDGTEVVMYKNPGCKCCDGWAAHMEQAGFSVTVKPTDRLPAVKKEQGVPYQLASCHTALVGGYLVEGHVPAADVKRMLKNQPDAVGIAVPGMPQGSPGMESPTPEPYKVYLVGNDGNLSVFAQHNVK